MAYPEWQAHIAVGYENTMQRECDVVLTHILADSAYRKTILDDSRALHGFLFAPFAPTEHREYGETYLGIKTTSLDHRELGSRQMFSPASDFHFEPASGLSDRVAYLLSEVERGTANSGTVGSYGKLLLLTHLFCWFGSSILFSTVMAISSVRCSPQRRRR